MNGEIISIKDVALGIKEFKIKIDSKIRFLNGQYVVLAFPEDIKIRRSYSILEYYEELDIIILLIKEAGEFTKRIHNSMIGQKLLVLGPYGKFTLKNNSKNIFIAGGIGIVPLYSMLNKIVLEKNNESLTYFYYSSRFKKEMALYDEFIKLKDLTYSSSENSFEKNNLHIKLYFTREGNMDRLNIEEIQLIPSFQEYNYYICGPDNMTEYLVDSLKKIGVIEKNIYTESFVIEKM